MLADREPFWARSAPTLVLMTVIWVPFPAQIPRRWFNDRDRHNRVNGVAGRSFNHFFCCGGSMRSSGIPYARDTRAAAPALTICHPLNRSLSVSEEHILRAGRDHGIMPLPRGIQ
jgi:hypothetical protein